MKKTIILSLQASLVSVIFGAIMICFYFLVKARSPDTTWLTAQSGDVLTADKWNNLVPSKTIIAIYDTTCPTWWKPADGTNSTPDLRGQFLRGLNTFDNWTTTRTDGNQDPDGSSRTVWNYQADQFKSHVHTFNGRRANGSMWSAGSYWYPATANTSLGNRDQPYTNNAWWNETRSKNVAIIYCMKN